MPKRKIFYYFRGSLDSHLHFLESWSTVAKESGLEITLITVLDIRTYLKELRNIKRLRSKFFKIYFFPSAYWFSIFYFGLSAIRYQSIVIHLKKRSTKPFFKLKRLLGKRIKYLIEFEGDAKSEAEFLKLHEYKPKFYDDIISSQLSTYKNEKKEIDNANGVLVVTKAHKKLLLDRYQEDRLLKAKVAIQPMSFSQNEMIYSESIRERIRKANGFNEKFIVVYTGNVVYSWQNLSKTIKLFKFIKSKKSNSLLLLLIRKQDHTIANEFITANNLPEADYILKSIPHEEMMGHLNASDLGISLRDHHIMNSIVNSGKLMEYLACGLPVITTSALAIAKDIKSNKLGLALEQIQNFEDNFEEIDNFISKIENYSDRKRISQWANKSLSMQNYISEYIDLISAI